MLQKRIANAAQTQTKGKMPLVFFLLSAALLLLITLNVQLIGAQGNLDQTGTQWSPYLEWSVENSSYSGNPFDVIANVTFVHTASSETRTTQMFYDGDDTWKWRFTGTRTGAWTFTTQSDDPELNGLSGTVTINANPDPTTHGFVTSQGSKWVHSATGEAFVPQFVMAASPDIYYSNPAELDTDIDTFIGDHGFNGFHIMVFCRWYDINHDNCGSVNNADPDIRTFETLEIVINRVYAEGGVVHLWLWGDESRDQNPKQRWGLGSPEDVRIQRYIAARLGPIPGWTMGYGFDLWEWVGESALTTWHNNMHSLMGWSHPLGARANKNELNQISEAMDYSGYEQHLPGYEMYVQTITARPEKPSFSEDRFRVRDEDRDKDYDFDMTRRGLWHSTMAGGVANIWGNLLGSSQEDGSLPYPNVDEIRTYFTFWENRFKVDMVRCNDLTDGTCLYSPGAVLLVFYKEDTDSITFNLPELDQLQTAVAVDTRLAYAETNILGGIVAGQNTWQAPYASDWAIVVKAAVIYNTPTPGPSPTEGPSPTPTATPGGPTQDPTNVAPTFTPNPPPGDLETRGDPHGSPYNLILVWHPGLLGFPTVNTWYRVAIMAESGLIFLDQWFPHAQVCDNGECSLLLSKDLFAFDLLNGTYSWWVMYWSDGIISEWSAETKFTIDVAPPVIPEHLQVFPNQGRPTIVWDNDWRAFWVHIYIGNSEKLVLFDWFEKTSDFCDEFVCRFTPNINPTGGGYNVYLQQWGPGGFYNNNPYAWTPPASLTISHQPPPPMTNLAMTATEAGQTVFQWDGIPRATWYQIWVGQVDPIETYHMAWYLAADLGCENMGLCTVNPNLASTNTSYKWFVLAWGPGGFSTGGVQGWAEGRTHN